MPEMNRRRFLIASAGVGAAGLLSARAGDRLARPAARGPRTPLPDGAGVLVIATLYGGNDGINTVIPYADGAYRDARPEIAYAPPTCCTSTTNWGSTRRERASRRLWNDERLAIIRGVGYPQPDHSHFRSMDIWQTASPTEPVSTGWIGRWLDATGDDPLRAVNIGPVLPPLAVGATHTAAALSPTAGGTGPGVGRHHDRAGPGRLRTTPRR